MWMARMVWYLWDGGMTTLIFGFVSNSSSNKYMNLVVDVVLLSVNLSCFLTLYNCSTSSCTLSNYVVSILLLFILPVVWLNHVLTMLSSKLTCWAFSRSCTAPMRGSPHPSMPLAVDKCQESSMIVQILPWHHEGGIWFWMIFYLWPWNFTFQIEPCTFS